MPLHVPSWFTITNEVANYEVQTIFWLCVLFIMCYSLLAKWWRNPFGRALVVLDAALAIAILPSLLSRYFGLHIATTEWVAWIDISCFAIVPLAVASRIYLVIKVNMDKIRACYFRSSLYRLWLRLRYSK